MADEEDIAHVVDLFLKDMDALESSQPVANVVRPQMRAPSRRTPTWLKRKRELAALRQQSEAMETRAVYLERQQEKRRLQLGITWDQLGKLHQSKLSADREEKQRRAVEVKNEALKRQLETCVRVSSAIQRAISAHNEELLKAVAPVNMGMLRQLSISSFSVVKTLEDQVDDRFECFQTVLEELRQASATLDEEHVRTCGGDEDTGSVLEYTCTRLLPFDVKITCDVAWSIVEEGGGPQKQASSVVRRSKDAHAVDSRFALPLGNDTILVIDVHCVAKRFMVPEGCALLAEACSEWTAYHEASVLWTRQSRESIWCILRDVSLAGDACGCQISAKARSEAVQKQETSPILVENAIVSSFSELVSSQRQCLENLLWDSQQTSADVLSDCPNLSNFINPLSHHKITVVMTHPPGAHASPSPSCSSASTASSSPQPIASTSSSSCASMQTSPTSEFNAEPCQSPIARKSPIKPRKPKSRRGRNRPIHEIQRLERQIPVLESEVRALWARADEMQRQELRARAENLQLRSQLKRSVAQAKLLESKLQLYQSQKQSVEASMLPSLGAVGRNLPYDAPKDAQILQMLSRSVDENYSKVQQVYQAAGLEEVKAEMSEAKVLETKDGNVLQIRSVALQPFDLETVLEAMWKALEEQTVLKDRECKDIGLELGEASRVIVLKREIVLRGGDDREEDRAMLSCTIRVVLKKFVEAGREIHVWDAFGDWSRAVTTREYGWGIMAPLDVKMDVGDITSVKNCIFMTSSTLSGTELNGVDQAAQHSVTRFYTQIMDDRRRVIENALLDQVRAARSYSP